MKEFRLMVSFKINSFYFTYSDSHEQKHDFRKDFIYNVFIKHMLSEEWIRKLWYIYTMEYYSTIKKNTFESVLMRWMKLEPIIQSEVSQKEKHQYRILMHIYGI